MRCPGCQHENRPDARFCDQCGTPLAPSAGSSEPSPSYSDLVRSLRHTQEQQTATSEILRAISGSKADATPVFDAICDSAARLCRGDLAGVFRLADGQLHEVSSWSRLPPAMGEMMRRMFPRPLDASTYVGRAILERRIVHVADMADPAAAQSATGTQLFGFRGQLTIPMFQGGEPIGGITVVRREPGLFSDAHIQLLITFADQAIIAIENVSLFKELQEKNSALAESLEQQTTTAEILRVISTLPTNLQRVLDTIASNAARVCGAYDATVVLREGDLTRRVAHHGPIAADYAIQRPLSAAFVANRAIIEGQAIHIDDILNTERADVADARASAPHSGYRTILAMPLLRVGDAIGALTIRRREVQPFNDKQIALLKTFADQAEIAIENVRLFRELEAANRELAAASQHKSEFLANMSHELRTPLNAIIGFSEVLTERMFGELTEKQEEYLKDIHASGQHLLSLINDILDLSKIEAGRMELDLTEFDLPAAIENALMLVRERAGRRAIALHTSIDGRLGAVQADERKLRQVVLNLLSNAIKFTPEGGRIDVGAVSKAGFVEVSVSDTGVGISPDDHEAVFEEFRQVGTASKKVEGTGLGLSLCRRFVELHGGRIWVESQLGAGSTFTFTIPARSRA